MGHIVSAGFFHEFCPLTDDLTLRRTVIGGQTAPDDYEVIWDELSIGRIFRSVGVGGIDGWSWAVILPNVPQRSDHRGGGYWPASILGGLV